MSKICCFTGHRPDKLYLDDKKIKGLLASVIERSYTEGYTSYISGMAMGFDILAAETVIDLRASYPDIKLICAIPYRGFERMRNKVEKERYNSILDKSSYVYYLSPKYSYSCFQFRNMWMVDRSQRVIAAFCGQSGGTKNTIDYAQKNGIEVVNILDLPY